MPRGVEREDKEASARHRRALYLTLLGPPLPECQRHESAALFSPLQLNCHTANQSSNGKRLKVATVGHRPAPKCHRLGLTVYLLGELGACRGPIVHVSYTPLRSPLDALNALEGAYHHHLSGHIA